MNPMNPMNPINLERDTLHEIRFTVFSSEFRVNPSNPSNPMNPMNPMNPSNPSNPINPERDTKKNPLKGRHYVRQ